MTNTVLGKLLWKGSWLQMTRISFAPDKSSFNICIKRLKTSRICLGRWLSQRSAYTQTPRTSVRAPKLTSAWGDGSVSKVPTHRPSVRAPELTWKSTSLARIPNPSTGRRGQMDSWSSSAKVDSDWWRCQWQPLVSTWTSVHTYTHTHTQSQLTAGHRCGWVIRVA